jgi:hypothetical protein
MGIIMTYWTRNEIEDKIKIFVMTLASAILCSNLCLEAVDK